MPNEWSIIRAPCFEVPTAKLTGANIISQIVRRTYTKVICVQPNNPLEVLVTAKISTYLQ